jgi:predicted enzyme related to lactoylglutathione lyase
MNRVIHFEIHAGNPVKIAKFYADVFGWEIKEWEMLGGPPPPEKRYWFVVTAPEGSKEMGINGGMVVRRGPAPKGGEPVSAFVCTINVPSVDEWLKKISASGGKTTLPKMAIPGMAWLAYCADPEGNIFGIFEEDKNAQNP